MMKLVTAPRIAALIIATSPALAFGQNLEEAPNPPRIDGGKTVKLKRQAGIGSRYAYAEAGVLEIGGAINFSTTDSRTDAGFTPSIGYFFSDNFQVSALTNFTYTSLDDVDDENSNIDEDTSSGSLVIEPSLHMPLSRQQFVFAGIGAGAYFAEGEDTGFAVAPRIGFKNLVGRSGMLSIALQGVYAAQSEDDDNSNGTVVTVEDGANLSFGYSVLL
ncbi:hypothetical protein [Pseudobacteriovorax antillogorgiicola]|uniref:Outer membrane protein beta-barrel domain-containing protein n=1 Tax=Pseudobacteriovorax antillogorgiicola TaxID=1513793 RepID=A0A1Y6CNS8_9BACT|nr:hypothetical protein [Pseudobacteriovorax antillogorgiicola]TCS46976.1 hypothetical protein EDD56_12271 [Pseudobacteriovorax antillogorgiicola]SMF64699.1 hypothetical protein SAMN06296036_12271 [Pseudobacteriovorax antillogorgiicola]